MSSRADRREAADVLRRILAVVDSGAVASTRQDGPKLTAIAAAAATLDTV